MDALLLLLLLGTRLCYTTTNRRQTPSRRKISVKNLQCTLLLLLYEVRFAKASSSSKAAIDAFNASHFDAIVIPKALRHDASSNLVANELEKAAFA